MPSGMQLNSAVVQVWKVGRALAMHELACTQVPSSSGELLPSGNPSSDASCAPSERHHSGPEEGEPAADFRTLGTSWLRQPYIDNEMLEPNLQ
jgi:hypothetical protein